MTRIQFSARPALLASAALTAVLSAAPAFAETSEESPAEATETAPIVAATTAQSAPAVEAPIEERQSYALRLMTQIYDGQEDLSHTQMLGVGRARTGNRSVTQFDFGDGSVVITPDQGQFSASRFANISPTERRVVYNYDSKTVQGDGEIAALHNTIIRQFLGRGPALGQDAKWSSTVPLSALDVPGLSGTDITIELSRSYFTHDGKEMVLIEYAIPPFGYDAGAGRDVTQWGRGFALTDPGFGMIYINAALHRAVETVNGQPGRPYRLGRAMVASNPDGSAMVDYREVERLKGKIDPVMGTEAMLVVPTSSPVAPDERPLAVGRVLDLLALSIGEDGANEVPIGASAQTGSDRGAEIPAAVVEQVRNALGAQLNITASAVPNSLVEAALLEVGARAATGEGQIFSDPNFDPNDPQSVNLYAEESVFSSTPTSSDSGSEERAANAIERMVQNGELSGITLSGGDSAEARAEGSGGLNLNPNDPNAVTTLEQLIEKAADQVFQDNGWGSDPFDTSQETLDALDESRAQGGDPAGDALSRVQGGGDGYALFGGGGGDDGATLQDKAAVSSTLATYGVTSATLVSMAETGQLPPTVKRELTTELTQFAAESQRLTNSYNSKAAELQSVKREILSQKISWEPSDELLRLERLEQTASTNLSAANDELAAALAHRAEITKQTSTMTDDAAKLALREAAATRLSAAIQDVQIAQSTLDSASKTRAVANADQALWIAKGADPQLLAKGEKLGTELLELEGKLLTHGQKAQKLTLVLKELPKSATQNFLKGLGGVATVAGHALNGYTIGASTANAYKQYTGDTGTGNVQLTRSYGVTNPDFYLGLGFDFLGLGLSVVSGDVPGALSTAGAIATSSVSDITVAFIGANRAQEQASAAFDALQETRRRRSAQLIAKYGDPGVVADLVKGDLAIARAELLTLSAQIDALRAFSKGESQARLEERRKAREEIARQQEEERRKQEERERQARVERDKNEPLELPPIPTGPDYPTRDPSTIKVVKKDDESFVGQTSELPQYILDDIEREKRRLKAQEELLEYQEKKLAERREAEKNNPASNGGSDVYISPLEVSELVVSTFDIDPVTFDPPVWKDPEFDEDGDLFVRNPDGTTSLKKVGPDDFEITPFDPPDISKIGPTDPDDVDGYPGTGEYPAFGFDNLSGTVNVDLSKWEDWLATQDIRKLIQLAIAAGYPFKPGDDGLATLAVALADAENIIRLSQDSGYRAWANRAPSCGGYVGCGPQYQGRWTQKRSIVALGDILAQSRGIFSTGGFTDIGISGFDLRYILRDFGIQDGDLIDVEITQFGRVVAKIEGHFLLTAGSPFNARLRPGVAQMVVTALNEGSASPNTAEVTIQNVVRGDGVQTYSLETGQTATLRIEANASPDPSGTVSATGTASSGQTTTNVAPVRVPISNARINTAIAPTPAPRPRESAPRIAIPRGPSGVRTPTVQPR